MSDARSAWHRALRPKVFPRTPQLFGLAADDLRQQSAQHDNADKSCFERYASVELRFKTRNFTYSASVRWIGHRLLSVIAIAPSPIRPALRDRPRDVLS